MQFFFLLNFFFQGLVHCPLVSIFNNYIKISLKISCLQQGQSRFRYIQVKGYRCSFYKVMILISSENFDVFTRVKLCIIYVAKH